MRKSHSYFIAPAAVLFIMMAVFLFYGMYPFGDLTLSWCDMNQQVIPFLMDFKDILSGKANMFLNLQNAGGMSFWGVFLFFISSPFTFLVAFVSKQGIYHLVNILVVLKMMTCSVTAAVFFNRYFEKLSAVQISAISVMYAFCGYSMFYYQNHVWLDIMYLFPVLLLGLEKLVRESRIGLYVFAFSAMLVVNFYLSYMISIFIVLAFGLYIIICVDKGKRGKDMLLLGISTVLVALLTAVIWMPSLLQYLNSARTGDLVTSLQIGKLLTRFDTTLALIFCTGVLFASVMLYFAFHLHDGRETHFVFYVFAVMMIPVLIEPINKMWHTGNYQAFPLRYGYIPIFFGLILFAIELSAINREPAPLVSKPVSLFVGMCAVSAVFVAACILVARDYDALSVYTKTLWGNNRSFRLFLAFFFVTGMAYYVIMLLYRYKRISQTALSALLCIIVLIQCVFNASVYVASPANSTTDYAAVTDLADKINDSSLYRVKTQQKYFDVNLIGSIGYNSLSHYTSLTNETFMYSMKKLGYSSYWMEVNSNGGTELTDAVLGNRYSIIRTSEIKKADDIIYQNLELAIKKAPVSMPFGFVMNSSTIQSMQALPDGSRLNSQQYIFQSLFHTSDRLITNYEPTQLNNIIESRDTYVHLTKIDNSADGNISYTIPVKGTQTLYLDCFDRISNSLVEHVNSSFNIYVNGLMIQEHYPSQFNNGLLNLGTFTDQTVQVEIEVLKDTYAKSFGIAGLDLNVLKYNIEKTAPAKLKQTDNRITGTAVAQANGDYLFLPLNYGKGYSVTVNNKKVEPLRILDSMMAVKLEKGSNSISVSYLPPGFQTGCLLTVAGILSCIGFFIFLKKGYYRKIRLFETPAAVVFWILFAFVFITVYIFPVYVYLSR